MNTRIFELRKHLKLTQAEFGSKIGLSRDGVASYERGAANPTGTAIQCISSVFGVNKRWLETGEGEMFENKTEDEILVDQALRKANASPVVRSLLMAWAKLPESCQLALEEYAAQFAAEYHSQQAATADADLSDQVRANIQANAVSE